MQEGWFSDGLRGGRRGGVSVRFECDVKCNHFYTRKIFIFPLLLRVELILEKQFYANLAIDSIIKSHEYFRCCKMVLQIYIIYKSPKIELKSGDEAETETT